MQSIVTDSDSLHSLRLDNAHSRTLEIVAQPTFHVFTSLLWIRGLDQLPELKSKTAEEEHHTFPADKQDNIKASLNEPQPELGFLQYHRDRMVAAAEALQWRHIYALERSPASLHILQNSISLYLQSLPTLPAGQIERRKLRIMINKAGGITVDSTVIDSLPLSEGIAAVKAFWPTSLDTLLPSRTEILRTSPSGCSSRVSEVFLDTCPSLPSLFTTHKTSYRAVYDLARARAGIAAYAPTEKEVLIYNKNGEVMEASLCTVYFLRDGQWITPAAICGGNLGVTRRLALEKGICKQGTIEIIELKHGEDVWLSNGARGFFIGRICLDKSKA